MRLIATRKDHQNTAAIDPWTVVHFAAGLAAGLMEVPGRSAMVAAVAYEVFEQVVERREVGQELFESSGPEHVSNMLVDVGIFALGHALGRRWNRT